MPVQGKRRHHNTSGSRATQRDKRWLEVHRIEHRVLNKRPGQCDMGMRCPFVLYSITDDYDINGN